MPDYAFRLMGDVLTVTPKRAFLDQYAPPPKQESLSGAYIIPLSPETLERAREVAPTWDVAVLADEWRSYAARQKEPPKNPDRAFLGFCRSWFEKRGRNGY